MSGPGNLVPTLASITLSSAMYSPDVSAPSRRSPGPSVLGHGGKVSHTNVRADVLWQSTEAADDTHSSHTRAFQQTHLRRRK